MRSMACALNSYLMYLDVSAYQDCFRVGGMWVILGIASCLVGPTGRPGLVGWPGSLRLPDPGL